MSVELYEQTIAKLQAAMLINQSLDDIAGGAIPIAGKEFFDKMRAKYGE